MLGQGQIKNEEDRSSSVVVVAPSLPLLDAMSGEARQSKQAGKQTRPGPKLYIPSTIKTDFTSCHILNCMSLPSLT